MSAVFETSQLLANLLAPVQRAVASVLDDYELDLDDTTTTPETLDQARCSTSAEDAAQSSVHPEPAREAARRGAAPPAAAVPYEAAAESTSATRLRLNAGNRVAVRLGPDDVQRPRQSQGAPVVARRRDGAAVSPPATARFAHDSVSPPAVPRLAHDSVSPPEARSSAGEPAGFKQHDQASRRPSMTSSQLADPGAMAEGAMTEGAMTEGAMTEGAVAEGAVAEGAEFADASDLAEAAERQERRLQQDGRRQGLIADLLARRLERRSATPDFDQARAEEPRSNLLVTPTQPPMTEPNSPSAGECDVGRAPESETQASGAPRRARLKVRPRVSALDDPVTDRADLRPLVVTAPNPPGPTRSEPERVTSPPASAGPAPSLSAPRAPAPGSIFGTAVPRHTGSGGSPDSQSSSSHSAPIGTQRAQPIPEIPFERLDATHPKMPALAAGGAISSTARAATTASYTSSETRLTDPLDPEVERNLTAVLINAARRHGIQV